MTTALLTHSACLSHDPGPGHPERIERLDAVLAALSEENFPALLRIEAPRATVEQLTAVHDPAYVDEILSIDVQVGEMRALDADTIVSDGSVEAALRAAGGAVAAVDLVMEGRARNAFVATRPPGHHAEPGRAMGFCLFNSVAVAAHHARNRWGLKRVAGADFDVHHGNGTQAAFWNDADLCFVSSHQGPYYPGTGTVDETGAHGNITNVPLAADSGSDAFRKAWQRTLLPALEAFGPELLIVSAGFDAHREDPLAQLRLETEDFGWITSQLAEIADRCASGRMISVLEGGYDLDALAASCAEHVRTLQG